MSQVDILITIQSIARPWLDHLMIAVSFLGDEQFYMVTIPLLYFAINKRIGVRLAILLSLSMFADEALKVVFASPRPIGVAGIRSLYTSSAPGYSFPSGHSQGTTTYWGYLATQVRKKWFAAFALVMIVAVMFSRMYLGVHWPLDVLGGLVFGLLFVSAAVWVEGYLAKKPLGFWTKLVVGAILPFVLLQLYGEAPGQRMMGFLLGCWVGHVLESRFVKMQLSRPWWKRILPALVVVGTTFALKSGMKIVLPAEGWDLWRYALVGFWGVFGAPWVFVKLGWVRGRR